MQPSKWNKDAIHWLSGPITVDLGMVVVVGDMKTYADFDATFGPEWANSE